MESIKMPHPHHKLHRLKLNTFIRVPPPYLCNVLIALAYKLVYSWSRRRTIVTLVELLCSNQCGNITLCDWNTSIAGDGQSHDIGRGLKCIDDIMTTLEWRGIHKHYMIRCEPDILRKKCFALWKQIIFVDSIWTTCPCMVVSAFFTL